MLKELVELTEKETPLNEAVCLLARISGYAAASEVFEHSSVALKDS